MKQKFLAIPSEIFDDIVSKKIINSDLTLYMYLCSKGAHGKPIYVSRSKICSELGGVSPSRVSGGLRRLAKSGHIKRTKLNGITSTSLLTFVKDKNHIFIKGLHAK